MFKTILKIAFRNFIKEKFYASINIIGLAIGVATCLLIMLYVSHETSYDTQHPDVDNLYRVNQTAIWNPNGGVMGSTVIPLAEALKEEIPGIESTCRINTPGGRQVNIEHGRIVKAYNEENVLAADSTFFDFFAFNLKEGNPKTALVQTNSVVLSGEIARKYFGNESALGKIILLGQERTPVRVTGVTEKHPTNIHFDFDLLLSMHTNPNIKRFEWSWIWTQVVTYVKYDGDPKLLNKLLAGIAPKYALGAFQRLGIDMNEFEKEKGKINFYLQPVKDIHLRSGDVGNRIGADSDILYVYIFGTVAIFVLLLASINFMNLTTARASNRAKEIGVKKVLGSSKKALIYQFVSEAIIMSLIATILGLGGMELMRNALVNLLELNFEISLLSDWKLTTVLIAMPILLGIVSGSYPAFYMTSFKPVQVLKGKLSMGIKNTRMRNTLVVFQFTIAITLIVCTSIVYKQLNYFRNGKMGFDKENVLKINNAEKLGDHLEIFREELKNHPSVLDMTVVSLTPGRGSLEDFFYKQGFPDEKVSIGTIKVDEDYLKTMQMELASGRNFSNDRPSDVSSIILNETAMRSFGLTNETALGQKISYYGQDIFEVIGVVKDFHSSSLRYGIEPLALFHVNSNMFYDGRIIAIRYNAQNLSQLISHIENEWKDKIDTAPFSYSYLDEDLARLYKNEEKLGGLFTVFTGLAMVIACFGLLGLASYITTLRNKEIGIRKVLGASVNSLIIMLNSNFSKLVMVSIALAIPISWWAMDIWLQQFNNKVSIGWDVFVFSGATAFLLTWLIVGYQSLRAAMLNPVDTLKDE